MTEQSPGPDEAPILFRRDGRAGHVVLNRPKAINALTTEMVRLMTAQLREWATDDSVEWVVVTGAGERGLCAGGDIVALWKDAKDGGEEAQEFWTEEYQLNALIKEYPKPYVAIMDGIVLGGGIGISAHGDVRVVTERSRIGMPETGIGFVPDVGGTYLLGHAPGETGTHLALTAGSVRAGDGIAIGLADHYVPSDKLEDLLSSLADTEPEQAVAAVAEDPPESPLLADREWLDPAYAGDDAEAIVQRLRQLGTEEATDAADTIEAKSPTSVKVTLSALRSAARMTDLREALRQEARMAYHCHDSHDFVEGVRAQVVDKDRDPKWSPRTLAEVSPARVEEFFAPIGEHELTFPDTPFTTKG
ncbi:enoyl-CoA hydratase/isomerase family protein [Marihabitans asiaticum]|uniref:3-hydroxyisobutyryl-CoA hydrolase n=1 Tax=Marihabitans asiaticum TaxID=415218 RepID=A0A560WDT8_9MICO|nr:enoyl-CoA hydratase/isomerase family protein [Marihabitans asiaticum]TWD15843.1 enoyl-CoA hydratase [Marihabitans asiaticum]